jgi:hypothetical protein
MRGIDLNWAGAERTFKLDIDLLRALEDKCDAGPSWVLSRLANEQWKVSDVYETIRFALEGGGMDKAAARKLVASHFADHPLGGSAVTAQTILMAALYSEEEDTDEGEPKAAVAN